MILETLFEGRNEELQVPARHELHISVSVGLALDSAHLLPGVESHSNISNYLFALALPYTSVWSQEVYRSLLPPHT